MWLCMCVEYESAWTRFLVFHQSHLNITGVACFKQTDSNSMSKDSPHATKSLLHNRQKDLGGRWWQSLARIFSPQYGVVIVTISQMTRVRGDSECSWNGTQISALFTSIDAHNIHFTTCFHYARSSLHTTYNHRCVKSVYEHQAKDPSPPTNPLQRLQ